MSSISAGHGSSFLEYQDLKTVKDAWILPEFVRFCLRLELMIQYNVIIYWNPQCQQKRELFWRRLEIHVILMKFLLSTSLQWPSLHLSSSSTYLDLWLYDEKSGLQLILPTERKRLSFMGGFPSKNNKPYWKVVKLQKTCIDLWLKSVHPKSVHLCPSKTNTFRQFHWPNSENKAEYTVLLVNKYILMIWCQKLGKFW